MNLVTPDFVADLLLYRLNAMPGLVAELDNDLYQHVFSLYKQSFKKALEDTMQLDALATIIQEGEKKFMELKNIARASEDPQPHMRQAMEVCKMLEEAYAKFEGLING